MEPIRTLKEIDLCHYDSDKTYKGRCWAYPILWKALRPGGYFISDDIEDNFAFREFVDKLGLEPIIVSSPEYRNDDYYVKYAGVIKKPIGWTNFFIVILLSQISAHHWFDKII